MWPLNDHVDTLVGKYVTLAVNAVILFCEIPFLSLGYYLAQQYDYQPMPLMLIL